MTFLDLVKSRRSIRKYTERQISRADMEKMLEIKRLFYGKNIDFSFFDNKLLIAVHTRNDMFETTSLLTSALSYYKVREVVSQMHAIFAVIDVVLEKS